MILTNNPERAQKLLRIISRALAFCYVVTIVVLVVLAGLGLFTIAGSDTYFGSDRFALNRFGLELNGVLRYQIDPAATRDAVSLRGMFTSMVAAAIVSAIGVLLVLRRLQELVQTVVTKQPFDSRNPSRVQTIAFVVIAGGLVLPALNSWVAFTVIETLSLESLTVVYSPDVNLVLTGLLLMVLAGVFSYGCHLQQEMDQTV